MPYAITLHALKLCIIREGRAHVRFSSNSQTNCDTLPTLKKHSQRHVSIHLHQHLDGIKRMLHNLAAHAGHLSMTHTALPYKAAKQIRCELPFPCCLSFHVESSTLSPVIVIPLSWCSDEGRKARKEQLYGSEAPVFSLDLASPHRQQQIGKQTGK